MPRYEKQQFLCRVIYFISLTIFQRSRSSRGPSPSEDGSVDDGMSLPHIEVDCNGDEDDDSPDVEVPAPAVAYSTRSRKPNLTDDVIDVDEAPGVKPAKRGARTKRGAKRAVGKKASDTDFGMSHWLFISFLSHIYFQPTPSLLRS